MKKYAEALCEMMAPAEQKKVYFLRQKIRNYYENIKQELGIVDTKFGQSDTWIYWDLAKQHHMYANPGESDERYLLADVLDLDSPDSRRLIQQITDRHLAWEISSPDARVSNNVSITEEAGTLIEKGRNLPNGLSSLDLAELGKLIREENGINILG